MISPCTVCEERFVGCHAECDAYKRWREDQDELKRRRNKAAARDSEMRIYNRQNSDRYLKRSRKAK